MSTIDDALLSAYLDGELAGPERASVEAALASQPSVGKRLATLKLVNELTRGHASSIDAIPLPARIRQLVTEPVDAAVQPATNVLPFYRKARVLLPLAASVVLVIGLGFSALQKRAAELTDTPLQTAHAALLQTLPSGESFEGESFSLTPQFSFISRDNQTCRIYRVDDASASHTRIACLDGGNWQLVDEFSEPASGTTGNYVPATTLDAALEARLDALMDGTPLTREQEQSLLENDWQAL